MATRSSSCAPCAESCEELIGPRGEACVFRNCLRAEHGGWDGLVAAASTREIMTFYPAAPSASSSSPGASSFSRQRCHETRAAVKPSAAFYEWLVARGGPAWQLRGEVRLFSDDDDGGDFDDAWSCLERCDHEAWRRAVRVTSTSLWGGAGTSRTPLHVDQVDAVIVQLAGRKRFFLASRQEIARAVSQGQLPTEVLQLGGTEHYDGSQEHLYPHGRLAVLERGDCLILPAGLYHDVQCGDEPALSLTIRFEPIHGPPTEAADEEDTCSSSAAAIEPDPDALRRLLWRLALKKAARDSRRQPPEDRRPVA